MPEVFVWPNFPNSLGQKGKRGRLRKRMNSTKILFSRVGNGWCCSTGIKETLLPCCKPFNATDNCGDVDPQGDSRYTLCDDPSIHVYWDTVHPVESTWKHVVELFYNESGYLIGSATLQSWLYENSLRTPAVAVAPPAPAPGEVYISLFGMTNFQGVVFWNEILYYKGTARFFSSFSSFQVRSNTNFRARVSSFFRNLMN